jgi:alkylhydroperoxidase/carboxymuconolactone decarboxylase family protein
MGENAPALWEKFMAYYGDVFQDGALSAREKALIAFGVAHAVQCPYCIDSYTQTLLELGVNQEQMIEAVHAAAAENMMCRNQISVDWDGRLYDCDFNLAVGLLADIPRRIQDLDDFPLERRIVFGDHCYACTAGAGSSCGGAIA